MCRSGISSLPGLHPPGAGGSPCPRCVNLQCPQTRPSVPRGRGTRLKTAELCFFPLPPSGSGLSHSTPPPPPPHFLRTSPRTTVTPLGPSGASMPSSRDAEEKVSSTMAKARLFHATPPPAQGPEERPVASESPWVRASPAGKSLSCPPGVTHVSLGRGGDLRVQDTLLRPPPPRPSGSPRGRGPRHQKFLGRAFPHPA